MLRRTLAGVAILLATVSVARAGGHLLQEKLAPGDCFHVELTLKLDGKMNFARGEKKTTLPLRASAQHVFPERVLAVAKDGTAEKVVRSYETAKATIEVGKHSSERTLRSERRLFVAQWQNDQPTAYSPGGPLYRTELDLCSEHFDTLHLVALLPGKEVKVGDSWKVLPSTVQALCHLEGVAEHAVTGKLETVTGKLALIHISGTTKGVDLGSLVKVTIDASAEFDLEAKRLVKLTWKQKEEREVGPVNPDSTAEATTTLTRTPVKVPAALKDVNLTDIPEKLEVPEQLLQLDYSHPKGEYDLLYTRDWTIVSETEQHLVLRLVDRGDFVAQARITPWTKAKPGKTMTMGEFERVTEDFEGWTADKTLQAGEVPGEKDRKFYRLSQSGKLDGVDVIQNFFLLAHEDGRQVIVTVTLTPKQAERLGTRDLTLAGSIDFPKTK